MQCQVQHVLGKQENVMALAKALACLACHADPKYSHAYLTHMQLKISPMVLPLIGWIGQG